MSRRLSSFAAVMAIAMSFLAVAAVSAQTGPGSPQPPPPPPPASFGPSIRLDATDFPFSFHFANRVFGFGFKPAERVTITVRNASASSVTAVADQNGSFEADIAFTWVFCGPGALQKPTPVVVATGSHGSTGRFSLYQLQCPTLIPNERLANPPSDSGGVTAGGGVVSGTAVAVGPGTTGNEQTNPTPAPLPTFPPRVATVDVQGFGFAPNERVTVHEVFAAASPPPPVQATADAQGRLRFTINASVPGHCSNGPHPQLVASGNAGTAVTVPLTWRDPLMSPCPAPGAPVASAPPQPLAAPGVAGPLSINLHPSRARRGGTEQAIIHGIGLTKVHLTVRYPDQRTLQRTGTADVNGNVTLRWRVPKGVRPGKAHVNLAVEPGNLALQTTFTVR